MLHPYSGRPWPLFGLLGLSLSLNLFMVLDRPEATQAPITSVPEPTSTEPPIVQAPADAIVPLPSSESTAPTIVAETQSRESSPFLAAEGALALERTPPIRSTEGWEVLSADVEHSLARTFQRELGEDGAALSAVYARLFMWDLDLRRDLQRGDKVEVAYKTDSDGQLVVGAARFYSQKLGRTLRAYRWQLPGDSFPSYWQANGAEVPYRLKVSPIQHYEQVTALLKDRPNHHGMDFKAPIGTATVSTRDGTIVRTNWNTRSNGGCVEIRYSDGVMAKYLHLSEVRVRPGDRVQSGDVVGLSGNTGRSTAPHLHYQLNKSERVLDPIDYHGKERRQLEQVHVQQLQEAAARLDAILGQAVARR